MIIVKLGFAIRVTPIWRCLKEKTGLIPTKVVVTLTFSKIQTKLYKQSDRMCAQVLGLYFRFGLEIYEPVDVHHHSRRTETALSSVHLGESFLDWMITYRLASNTFDCRYVPSLTCKDEHQALKFRITLNKCLLSNEN